MIAGFFDARELADVCDCRASTIRRLVAESSDVIPEPVFPLGRDIPLWPIAAINSWRSQGSPAGWQYDAEEFTRAALAHYRRANATEIARRAEEVSQ